LGVTNNPFYGSSLPTLGAYLYNDIYYRQWVSEVALAHYEGRADTFVYHDLVKQFRHPDKQQIVPMNITKEIIDETSILYKEDPIHQIVDSKGRPNKNDQELWEKLKIDSRYLMIMDKVDRWTKLLGTVLVKVSFVDPSTGKLVDATEGGQVQLEVVHSGVYDVKYGASPYYITELLIGFSNGFSGFGSGAAVTPTYQGGSNMPNATDSTKKQVAYNNLAKVTKVYWTPQSHMIEDEESQFYETENPYGCIPAVPFFNQDPAHYYYLPINESLIYTNHAINMRLTDLNHIAKFQSFGIPVIKGMERSKGTRQGRPVDDFNELRGGSAQSRFGGIGGVSAYGLAGNQRNFSHGGFGMSRDGNADANALGFTLGPDTAVSVGEKGDFKFAHPNADINGLVNSIRAIYDMVRVTHGLKPKYEDKIPPSGFASWMEKQGVMDENAGRRGKLFAEREAQLFQVIKSLWNTHHSSAGDKRFSEDSKLIVTYVPPKFPLDPKTQMEKIGMEQKLLETGDRQTYKDLYPYLTDIEINKMIKQKRKDKHEQQLEDTKNDIEIQKMLIEHGIILDPKEEAQQKDDAIKISKPKIDNRAKHSEDSALKKDKPVSDKKGK